ncbi:LURP-one-related/scramblase family protein [Marinactinospora thermotolerans]|uniref:Uncharacterized protein YxjI n=1 Tax=Marinactinospora thermotolerans DSM 45154 TaxID=1122192 RepID=A0A1T4S5D2_9ACTN|nr:LURP-one-related family protein [Marinactinospora thermotolerans]SKA23326.1 Uncharacterized protein YxjI [Marinactinospora thermotolerans DSM 45154]
MKFLVRERLFDIGDDYWIEDEEGRRIFLVDGKALRLRTTFVLKDAEGAQVAVIRAKALAVRDTMRVERDGHTVATVRKKLFSPFRDRLVVELAEGGAWEVTGDLLGKEYAIGDAAGPVAQVSRRWFRLRDTYAVDVNTFRTDAGGDPVLVLCVAVCVDAMTRGDDRGDD